jgi:hypothetical protein
MAKIVRTGFQNFFGGEKVFHDVPSHPCEDFSLLARAIEASYVIDLSTTYRRRESFLTRFQLDIRLSAHH